MNLSFENIDYLWAFLILIPLILLFAYVVKWKRDIAKSFADAGLMTKILRGYSAKLFGIKFCLIIIALIIGIIALANLRKNNTKDNEKSAGIDIIIALDVSRSMLSQDIKPTRLDRAKQLIGLLTNDLYNNRAGFVVFAGQAILQMPLTDDVGAIKMYLSNINTDAVPVQGTAIGDALLTANSALNEHDKKHKAVILITDGEDHDEATSAAITALANNGVKVFTVGVGTAGGSPILDPATNEYKKDENGNTVISKLNEAELKDIAQKTGGEYVLLDNDYAAVNSIVAKINSMEKKIIETDNVGRMSYFYYFPFFIGAVLFLLLIELFIPEKKKTLA